MGGKPDATVRSKIVALQHLAGNAAVAAALVACVDRRQVDLGEHARLEGVLRKDDRSDDTVELASDVRDHKVPDLEGHVAVDRIDRPLAGDVAGDLDGVDG